MSTTSQKYPMWDTLINYLDVIEEVYGGMMSKKGEQIVNPQFIRILTTYLRNLYKAEVQGIPRIMYNFCIPPEILYALEAHPVCQEAGSVALSIAGKQHLKYIDLAEEKGIPPEQCNAQKIWIGAAMLNEAPIPNGIIYASQPCDSTNILYQVLENMYHIPTYTMDVPYWHFDEKSKYYDERTLPYFTEQMKGIIPWAEKHFNLKYNFENLKHVIDLSNQAREATLDINELMKAVPSPLPSMITFTTYMTLTTSAGTQEAAEYCKWTRDKAASFVKRKTSPLQEMYHKEEKFRVIWIYIPVFWDFMIYDWMERKLGAVIVMDLMGYHMSRLIDNSSEESIFKGLAESTLSIPMGAQSRGPVEYYLDYLLHVVKEYKADCTIFGGHLGCKHSWAVANLLKEELYKNAGIPTLIFEVDTMDQRLVTDRMIKDKLQMFFKEMI